MRSDNRKTNHDKGFGGARRSVGKRFHRWLECDGRVIDASDREDSNV
jgi:hypothetical protein